MPPVTRWYIKTSLLWLITGLLIGALLAAGAVWRLPHWFSGFNPVYFHLFMVGWVAQLIFGIAFWMFPKFSKAQPRGYERLAWATYGLLNIGLVLRTISEPLNTQNPGIMWGWLLALSAILQWLAGVCFVVNTWPRIKGNPARPR